ncbi:MAG: WG repeat-containing protein [Xenococcaceae cyanobacterium]
MGTVLSGVFCTVATDTPDQEIALYPFRDDDTRRWGFLDAQGNTVIEPKLAQASSFNKGLAVVKEPPLVPYGYINQQGEYVWKSVEF